MRYRRIPVLAIGNDIYCDTSLIALTLEKHFKPEDGFDTIFPSGKNGEPGIGLQKAFSTFYGDRSLFPLATGTLPWNTLPKSFLEDRNEVCGVGRRPDHIQFYSRNLTMISFAVGR